MSVFGNEAKPQKIDWFGIVTFVALATLFFVINVAPWESVERYLFSLSNEERGIFTYMLPGYSFDSLLFIGLPILLLIRSVWKGLVRIREKSQHARNGVSILHQDLGFSVFYYFVLSSACLYIMFLYMQQSRWGG